MHTYYHSPERTPSPGQLADIMLKSHDTLPFPTLNHFRHGFRGLHGIPKFLEARLRLRKTHELQATGVIVRPLLPAHEHAKKTWV